MTSPLPAMAASSVCNFLSFLIPLHLFQTKQQPNQVIPPSPSPNSTHTLSSSCTSLQSRRSRDAVIPVMANEGSYSSNDFMSVICPSLAYANTLFFKSAYNVELIVGENEPEEVLLKRFRKKMFYSGVIQESKRKRFFENKQEEKKRKAREAAKRRARDAVERKARVAAGWNYRREKHYQEHQ